MEFTWYGITKANDCPPRVIDNYTFLYITSGGGTFYANGKKYDLEADDLFILFPGDLHSYYASDPPWNLLWFGITGEGVAGMLGKAGLEREQPVLKKLDIPAIPGSMKQIISHLQKKSTDGIFFALAEFHFFLGYISTFSTHAPSSTDHAEKRIQQALRFIELNYVYDLDASTLASQAGYTRTYFSTLFHQYTGKTPLEYLEEVRMRKALSLLTDTQLTIQEVSISVGFQDTFYFSKVFKKNFRMSPTQFRGLCKKP